MAEIVGDVNELKNIGEEIKRLNVRMRQLRNRYKEVESKICSFLKEKDQPGLKYKGMAIFAEDKEYRQYKNPKIKKDDAASILKQYGISDSSKIIEEIVEAMKGPTQSKKKIKLKQIKDSTL